MKNIISRYIRMNNFLNHIIQPMDSIDKFIDIQNEIKIARDKIEHQKHKENVTNKINGVSYEKALRYITHELSDLKTKPKDDFNKDTIKFMKQKQREINKSIRKQEKQEYKLNKLYDENTQLKNELKDLKIEKRVQTPL